MSDSSPSVLFQSRFLRLCEVAGWEFAESSVASGVAATVAETEEGELVIIEQWRRAVGAFVLEWPGGLSGDDQADEALESAARRELLEETGFGGGQWRPLGLGSTSPGLTSELVHLFHAQGVRQIAPGGGVDDEQITVHLVPKAEVRSWLEQRQAEGRRLAFQLYAGLWLLGC